MTDTVLNPVQEPVSRKVPEQPRAPRLSTLDGKVLGLRSNRTLNADKVLELVLAQLQRTSSFSVIRGSYNGSTIMAPAAWDIAADCDAVFLATGDCGSCSTSGLGNAIELEKRGIPALLISTAPFFEALRTTATMRGMPTIGWAVVDHPIGALSDDELAGRALSAAGQFREIILDGAPVSATA